MYFVILIPVGIRIIYDPIVSVSVGVKSVSFQQFSNTLSIPGMSAFKCVGIYKPHENGYPNTQVSMGKKSGMSTRHARHWRINMGQFYYK